MIDNCKIARALQPHVTLQFAAGPHKVVVKDFQSSGIGGTMRVGIVDQRKLVSEAAKTLAVKAVLIVIAAGFDPDSESEGADRTFDLPFGQEELIRELSAANSKTVVAVTSRLLRAEILIPATGWIMFRPMANCGIRQNREASPSPKFSSAR